MIDLPETKQSHELNRFALQIYGKPYMKLALTHRHDIETVWQMRYHGVTPIFTSALIPTEKKHYRCNHCGHAEESADNLGGRHCPEPGCIGHFFEGMAINAAQKHGLEVL